MMALSDIRPTTGRRGVACRCAAALLVATLLLQILPFTFTAAPPACGGGFAQYIEPLPMCGEQSGSGGFSADHTWLPAPGAPVVVDAPGAVVTPPPFVLPAAAPGRRLFRPPRA